MRVDQQLKNKIYDRVQMLVEGKVEDPAYEKPMSKEALTAHLTEILYRANDLRFHTGMALGDLGINRNDDPPLLKDLEDAFDALNIPTV